VVRRREDAKLAPVHEPSELHLALAQVPAPVLFTTNYDLLTERAIERVQGVPPDVVIEDGHVGLINEARRTTIVTLHGCLTLPETIVLTRDDYEPYADRHRAMVAYLQSLLATRTFLFVGFSLVDPNFRAIYSAIARALGPHKRQSYLIEGAERPEPLVSYWRQKGIVTITLDKYDRFPAFVREVTGHTPHGRSAVAAARTLGHPEPPPLSVGPLLEHLDAVRGSLAHVIAQARGIGLLPEDGEPSPEVPAVRGAGGGGDDGLETGAWLRRKARAARLGHCSGGARAARRSWTVGQPWRSALRAGRRPGAIQAYQAALRPASGPEGLAARGHTVRRVRGNLA
jgi:hypothetical protein